MIKPQINCSHTDFHAVSCFSQTFTQAPHLTQGSSVPGSQELWEQFSSQPRPLEAKVVNHGSEGPRVSTAVISSLVLDRMGFVCCEFLFS